jgi:hypothetical protein
MKPWDSMQHSEGLPNNPHPLPTQSNSLSYHLFLQDLQAKAFLGVYCMYLIKCWKQFYLLPFWLCPVHLNLPDLITLTILGEQYKLRSSYSEAICTSHSQPFCAQKLASGSWFQIFLAHALLLKNNPFNSSRRIILNVYPPVNALSNVVSLITIWFPFY